MRLNFFKFLKWFFFLCNIYFTTAANAETIVTPANELSEKLQNIQTYSAKFSQQIVDKNGESLQKSEGTMSLKRPGLFRWETLSPNQQLIIADGKHIWIYDKDLEQVTEQKQTAANNAPGLLLSDSVERLVSRFNIKKSSGKDNIFILTPKGKKDLFQSVTLIFDQNNLSQMVLFDNLGQTTKIIFSAIKINPDLSTSFFQFVPPKSIDVVHA